MLLARISSTTPTIRPTMGKWRSFPSASISSSTGSSCLESRRWMYSSIFEFVMSTVASCLGRSAAEYCHSRLCRTLARVKDDLTLALELADMADAISLPRFGAADLLVETKSDLTPVTEADRAVEKA